MENTINGENRIRKVLFNEISFAIAIIAGAFAVFGFLTNPGRDNMMAIEKLRVQFEATEKITSQLQNIKDNDLHTIDVKVDALSKEVKILNDNVIRLETLINERLPTRK